jgi:type I restriction enzyme S subunit
MRWEYSKLEEIAEFRNGVNFTSDSFGRGIKVINVADFKDKMYPDYEDLGELDSEGKWSKECFLKENDIVFVRSNGNKNLIGRSIFIKDLPQNIRVTYSAFCIRLRFNNLKNISPEFYLYLFKSPIFRGILSQFGNGTNISNLNQDILNNMAIPRPSLLEQRKIASILSSYDELIENNKQRIRLLEEMAEEIYKEWFVRLRFPGFEIAKFVDGLPEGWKWAKVEDIFKTSSGGTPSRERESDYHGGEIDWIKTGELKDTFVFDSEEKISEVGLKNSSAKMFPPATLLMAMYGVNIGQLGISVKPSAANQAVCVFTAIKSEEYSLFYSFFFFKSIRSHLFNISMGAAQQNLSQDLIKRVNYFSPYFEIVNKYDSIVKPFFEEIKILSQKNQLLQQTRDLLLPRLISGKLSVEHLVEEEERLSMAAEPEVSCQAKE